MDLPDLLYPHASPQRQWLMSHAERAGVLHVLARAQAENAIEVGTCEGGCLDQIRAHTQRVYSIDIDPTVKTRLGPLMPEVEFLIGDSAELIGTALQRCAESGKSPGFILIDGDHTYRGVQADIHAVLQHRPNRPMWIVMHDSFNPACRRGIQEARWADNPCVHHVMVDYVPGNLHTEGMFAGQMWGGLALAWVGPEPRTSPLKIEAGDEALYQRLYHQSWHPDTLRNRLRYWLRTKQKGLERRLKQT